MSQLENFKFLSTKMHGAPHSSWCLASQNSKAIHETDNVMQEIDLRIGASFTRFQTMLLRDAFILDSTTDETNVVLSYGPCQVGHTPCSSVKQEKINKKFLFIS